MNPQLNVKSILRSIPSARAAMRQPMQNKSILNIASPKPAIATLPDDQSELRKKIAEGDYTDAGFNFSEAFRMARKSGLKEFTWVNPRTGKSMRYGTNLASESTTRTPAAPQSNQPSDIYASAEFFNNIYSPSPQVKPISTTSTKPAQKLIAKPIAQRIAQKSAPSKGDRYILDSDDIYIAKTPKGVYITKKIYDNVGKMIKTNAHVGDKKYSTEESEYLLDIILRTIGPPPSTDAIGHPEWITTQKNEYGAPIKQVKNPRFDVNKAVEQKNAIYKRNQRIKTIKKMYGVTIDNKK